VLEGLAVKELHGDEGAAVLFADVIDGADVGVIEGGGGFGFAAETFEGLAVAGGFFGEEFEGDEAVQASVFGLEDDAHAAATELFEDTVVGDGLTDEGLGFGHGIGEYSLRADVRGRNEVSQRGGMGSR